MTSFTLTRLSTPWGAEVQGLDPKSPLNEEDRRLLQRTFDAEGLLVFRDLEIDRATQNSFSDMLIGRTSTTDISETDPDPDGAYVSNKRQGAGVPFGRLLFHSDTMWADEPLHLGSLYGLHVDEPAVPTIYASAAYAWDTLPEELRARVQGLSAVHVAGQHKTADPKDADLVESLPDRPKSTTKPITNGHVRTNRTLLYVCEQMTHAIVGMPQAETDELLSALFKHLYNPENLYTHQWREGDLVVWDNIAIQHARPNVQEEGPVRTLRRFNSPIELIPVEQRNFGYTRSA